MSGPILNAPTSACASSLVMTLSSVVGLSSSPFTFEEQSFKWPGERWAIAFNLPPFVDADIAEEWIAFALKLGGQYGRFLIGEPLKNAPRGVGGGAAVVDGAGQSGNSLFIRNAPVNLDDWLKTGDNFQLGSGSSTRLHKITAPVSTDSSGNAEIEFVPATRGSPADGAAVTINNAMGLFRMDTNDVSYSREPGGPGRASGITRFSFTATEWL